MPKKRTSDSDAEPAERRRSARIESLPKPTGPELKREAPERKARLSPQKRKSESGDVIEISDGASSPVPKKRGRPSKKSLNSPDHVVISGDEISDSKSDSLNENSEKNKLTESNEKSHSDFIIVNKESIPSPNSEEVKKAVEAQGADGGLLVDYVQVIKDELPSPNSEAIKDLVKQADAVSHISVKKSTHMEEPVKEVVTGSGCNGNCGVNTGNHHNDAVTNGLSGQDAELAKNGNHDTTAATAHVEKVDASATLA